MATSHLTARFGVLVCLVLASALSACVFGGGKKNASSKGTPAPRAAASITAVAPAAGTAVPGTPVPGTATSVASTAAPAGSPSAPFTPSAASPTASPTPAASPTPSVRDVNGLQVQDVRFRGKVTAPGGLRIRSSPDASGSNIVGSVEEGAAINVDGKVLNGAEAEPGKGTIWYIVGPNQYLYGADGYVEVTGTPVPAGTPAR